MTTRFLTQAGDYLIADDGSYLATGELSCDLVSSATTTGGLSTSIRLGASLTSAASASNNLSAAIQCSASASAASSVSPSITASITPISALISQANFSGSPTTRVQVSSTLSAVISTASSLSTTVSLSAPLTATGSLTPIVSTAITPRSFLSSAGDLSGGLTNGINFSASLAAAPSITAPLLTKIDAFASLVSISNTGLADLSTGVLLASGLEATSSPVLSLTNAIRLGATPSSASTFSSALTTAVLCSSDSASTASCDADLFTITAGYRTEIIASPTFGPAPLSTEITPATALTVAPDLIPNLATGMRLVADLSSEASLSPSLLTEIDAFASVIAVSNIGQAYLSTEIDAASHLVATSALAPSLTAQIQFEAAPFGSASFESNLQTSINALASAIGVSNIGAANLSTQIDVASSLLGISDATSALTTSIRPRASIAATSSVSSDLKNGILMAAAPAAVTSFNAPITTSISLNAPLASSLSSSATASTGIRLASSLTSSSGVTSDLRTSIDAFASVIAVSNVGSADLKTSITAAADLYAVDQAQGLLGSIIELSAAIASDAKLTPALKTQITLSSGVSALSALQANLGTSIRLSMSVSATASESGAITTQVRLAATPSQTSTASASLSTAIRVSAALSESAVFAAELKTSITALTALIGVSNIANASLSVTRLDPAYSSLNSQIYLAEIEAYDPTTSSVITWRFASGQGYDNGGVFYPPRIEQPANLKRSIGGSSVGGRTSMSYGELTLANLDGGINAIADDYFDGRTLTLKRGNPSMPYNTFTTVLVATVESVAMERERASIRLRDKAITLDQPFSTVKYAGTNTNGAGIEGTADDIKGQSKPRIFGRIALMPPTMVNSSKLIYQINNGAVDNVINVFDAGAYLTRSTDYTSQADMEGNDPASGTWRAWPGGGCIRLGSVPFGQVSVCVAEKWDYSQCTAAGLIQRILTEVGYTSANWLASDFTTLNQKNAGSLGIVVSDGETTAALLDRICQSVGAWWGFDSLGRFRVARLDAPSGTASATLTDSQILELERQAADQLPVWQTVLKSDINYSKQDKKSLAGVVPANRANWFEQESRDQKVENASVKTQRLLAEDQTYDSLLNGISVANAESARRLALFSTRRDTVNLTVANPSEYYSSIDLGSVISVQTSKLGYDAGRLMTVTGVSLDYQANTMDITCWG